MNDEESFLSHLRQHPDDLITWGVYADWLDEHGNRPATAEMIRRHVKTAHDYINEGQEPNHSFLYQDTPRGRIVSASHLSGYIKAYPEGEHDLLSTLIPSGQSNHVLHLSTWMPRKVSKRLIPALHNEGIDFNLPNDADENTREMRRRWDADKTTVPEVQQMSRDKPLVVSYDKNFRRFSLKKKYASPTVGQVMGLGKSAEDIHHSLIGSRLGTVLREIKHGSIGKSNPVLEKLATHGLSGSFRPELFTKIRDELLRTNNERAIDLAKQYNWHKIGHGLERDKHLRDFVKLSSQGTKHENDTRMFRKFYNGIVHGVGGPDNNTRVAFYNAMRNHLKKQTGRNHSDVEIQDSLRRLGDTEENIENINRRTTKSNSAKAEVPNYSTPAYHGNPKPGLAPGKLTPIEHRAPGQFKRRLRIKK